MLIFVDFCGFWIWKERTLACLMFVLMPQWLGDPALWHSDYSERCHWCCNILQIFFFNILQIFFFQYYTNIFLSISYKYNFQEAIHLPIKFVKVSITPPPKQSKVCPKCKSQHVSLGCFQWKWYTRGFSSWHMFHCIACVFCSQGLPCHQEQMQRETPSSLGK